MRVLYCTDTYLPQVNGVTVVTDVSVRGLMQRGWDVEVVAPRYTAAAAERGKADEGRAVMRGDAASADPAGVSAPPGGAASRAPRVHPIFSVPAPRYPELRVALPDAWTIYRAARRFEPDLVHCTTEFVIGRLGMWAADRLGVPVVTSYHTNFGQYTKLYGLGRLTNLIERYISSVHRNGWRTYTPSASSRDELWRMGVSDVEVWGRGVDLSLFSPTKRSADLRTRLGVESAFTFLYVGRLAPEKSVHVVVQAFARLTEMMPGNTVRLIVAGSGPAEASLRAMAPRGTVFLGNLDRATELPELYATADAFAFASVTETLGLVVLEAMASGLPVIATPAGGVAEHLRDGVNGMSYKAGDVEALAQAMLRLATTAGLRESLSEGALATAKALGWDAELDRLDQSYRAVCAEASAVRDLPLRLGLRKG